jgi:hypothetical protein
MDCDLSHCSHFGVRFISKAASFLYFISSLLQVFDGNQDRNDIENNNTSPMTLLKENLDIGVSITGGLSPLP